MQTVELLVKLKIPDVTALTAANTVRRRMGYADRLTSLRRADYYRLGLAVADPVQAERLARELAEGTNLFVNPNKHQYEVRLGARQETPASEGVHAVSVLVTDPADGSATGMLSALRGRLGYGQEVVSLLRGVLWTLWLRADSPEEARQMAQDIAVTTSRERGLLANPHFQECEIW